MSTADPTGEPAALIEESAAAREQRKPDAQQRLLEFVLAFIIAGVMLGWASLLVSGMVWLALRVLA